MKRKVLDSFLDGLAYTGFAILVYWGTLFALASLLDFIPPSRITDVIDLALFLLGLMVWLLASYYVKRIRSVGSKNLAEDFFSKYRIELVLMVVFLLGFFILANRVITAQVSEFILEIFRWLLLPWNFGELVAGRIKSLVGPQASLYADTALPVLMQMIFFWYVAKLLTKLQKKEKKNL